MRTRSKLLLGAAVVSSAGLVAASRSARRRWERAEDKTGGRPLTLPDGEDRIVETSDGAKIEVRVAGPADGQAYVLVHGWTNDRRVWGAVADRLVDAGRRVVLVNQRGHGGSTVGDDGYTLDAIGSDVRAVLEQLDLHDVVLVGHSMGGMASMAFLTGHSDARERVAAVALVSTAAGGVGGPAARASESIAAAVISHPRLERAMESAAVGPLLVRNTVGRNAAQSHLEAVRELFVATAPAARAGFLRSMVGMDLSDALRDLDLETVIVVGKRDRLTPPALARQLAKALPHARLVVLDDVGHMLPFEAPDEVAEVLLELPVLGVGEVEAAAGVPG